MAKRNYPDSRIGSLDRFVRSIRAPLTDNEERYYVILLRGSPRNEKAVTALFRGRLEYLLKILHRFEATATYSGLEKDDLLSLGYEAVRKAVPLCQRYSPTIFGSLLGLCLRNVIIDRIRACNRLVRMTRRDFITHVQNRSFVREPFPDVSDPVVQAEVETSGYVASGGLDVSMMRVVVQRNLERILENERVDSRDLIILKGIFEERTNPEIRQMIAASGLRLISEPRVLQLRARLMKRLRGNEEATE